MTKLVKDTYGRKTGCTSQYFRKWLFGCHQHGCPTAVNVLLLLSKITCNKLQTVKIHIMARSVAHLPYTGTAKTKQRPTTTTFISNVFLNTEVKGSLLILKVLVSLFTCLTKIYSTYHFTLKSINSLDEIRRTKSYGENCILHRTAPAPIKIKKQNYCKFFPMSLISILKNFPFTLKILDNKFNITYIF